MTEAEWQTSNDPTPMVEYLRDSATERKLRLFAVSAVWPLLVSLRDTAYQELVQVVSEASEGTLNHDALRNERNRFGAFSYPTVPPSSTSDYLTRAAGLSLDDNPFRAALRMIAAVAHLEGQLYPAEASHQMSRDLASKQHRHHCYCRLASYVRDIFGNPFRSTGIKRQWRPSTALALAHTMYDSRDFSTMPILADALQDAGCDDEDVLNHCRQPGEHVRGCWLVDLLLNKQ